MDCQETGKIEDNGKKNLRGQVLSFTSSKGEVGEKHLAMGSPRKSSPPSGIATTTYRLKA